MRRNKVFQLLPMLLLWLTGCQYIFYVPLTITGYSPEREAYLPTENPAVWVEFSAGVDHSRAEEAFSLSKENAVLTGRFDWNGDRMTFVPLEAFATGCQYIMKVDTSVEDAAGNSLEKELVVRFRFGDDVVRPVVEDFYPATARADCDPYDRQVMGGNGAADLYYPITVRFSESVDQGSFYEAFSIVPDVSGTFAWPEPETVVFTPALPYEWQTEYKISVSTDLRDVAGNSLAEAFLSHFYVGTDVTPPVIVSVTGVPPVPSRAGEAALTLTENATVTRFEADWDIVVQFDEPVTRESIEHNIAFSPDWDCRVEYDPLFPDRVRVKRVSETGVFTYGSVYSMTVKKGVTDAQGNKTQAPYVYLFTVNGRFTKPPEVIRVCYLDNRTSALNPIVLTPLTPLSIPNTPATAPGDMITGLIDVYFSLADDAFIPSASFIENMDFDITNGCIKVNNYVSVYTFVYGDTIVDNPPYPPLEEHQALVRLYLQLVNEVPNGSFIFTLSKALCDQATANSRLHNRMWKNYTLQLLDAN